MINMVTGGQPYRHVIGFEAGEQRRADKDRLYNNSRRTGWYPLIELGMDRQACAAYVQAKLGTSWFKSCCTFCVYAMSTAAGRSNMVQRYRREPLAGAQAMFMEAVSRRLNERQTLIAGNSVAQMISEAGLVEVEVAFQRLMDETEFAVYEVRRVTPAGREGRKGVTARSVRRLACGSQADMNARLAELPGRRDVGADRIVRHRVGSRVRLHQRATLSWAFRDRLTLATPPFVSLDASVPTPRHARAAARLVAVVSHGVMRQEMRPCDQGRSSGEWARRWVSHFFRSETDSRLEQNVVPSSGQSAMPRGIFLKETLRANVDPPRLEGWGRKGAAIMVDHLQESAPKHAVEPQDLNAITASMFEGHIGLEFTETKPDRVQARVTMNPVLRQATGVVHGGVYCSIVETVASWGGLLSLDGAGHVVGVNNNTDFLRGVRDDNLFAEGTPVFRGRSQQLWRVIVTTAGGRECAVGQVRLHNVYNEDTAPKAQTVAPEPGAMR